MYPNSIYFGPNVPIRVLQGQSRYYLGTWTLRVVAVLMIDMERSKDLDLRV